MRPIPAWWWSWLSQAKKRRQKSLASAMQPKRFGNWGWYLRVLKWASENGLSLEVCGRLCDLVTPRSASIRAVALAFMGPPRSAWRVSWPGGTACFSRVSSNSALNRVGIGDAPADDPAAEDVENDVQIEVGPFRRSHQLRNVPRPDLIRSFGQQFGFRIDGMAQLIAAFADFVVVVQDPIQGPDRAVVDALVEQGGIDFGRSQIGKARLAQSVEHCLSFFGRQRAGRARSGRGRRQWGDPTRAVAIDSGARHAQGLAGGGGKAVAGRQGDHRLHHGSSSLSGVARGIPSKEATFFQERQNRLSVEGVRRSRVKGAG